MSKHSRRFAVKLRIGAAVALCGLAAFVAPAATSFASQTAATSAHVAFDVAPELATPANAAVGQEVKAFLTGMRDKDAAAVWKFASEEDQDAFQTERALYDAFAVTFPVLTQTREAFLQGVRTEGDTPFVQLVLTSDEGESYSAAIGFWLDDAGDWKVISCDITPATDQVAAL